MRATVLVLIETISEFLPLIEAIGLRVVVAGTAQDKARAMLAHGPDIRAVLTRGTTGLSAQDIASLPNLEIICALGAGYENIDLRAAAARGIVVTYGPGLNAATVADHAMALLLAVVRGIPSADASVRRGEWDRALRPGVSGKRLGILGLGAIGSAIAARAAGGFAMAVHYHNRTPRPSSTYVYQPSVVQLAQASDILVIAAPGGPGTRHLVDAIVLKALGPGGFLINIARGSIVDTPALVEALRSGAIAGAALDVFETEPNVPDELKHCPNVVLTPHVAGRAPEAVRATVQHVADNLAAHFAGRPVLTPIGRDAPKTGE
ncbi:MAG: 2-hydroxyacid dehydrogenase [Pseudomonadota bacterium]